jgi:hypothetical protein
VRPGGCREASKQRMDVSKLKMPEIRALSLRYFNTEITKEKNTYIQTSRLENPEDLQLHRNHEQSPVFDCDVALCTIQNVLLVISNLT